MAVPRDVDFSQCGGWVLGETSPEGALQDQWKLCGPSALTAESQCQFCGLCGSKQSQTCLDSNGGHHTSQWSNVKEFEPWF